MMINSHITPYILVLGMLSVLFAGCAGVGSHMSSAEPPATVTTPVVSAPTASTQINPPTATRSPELVEATALVDQGKFMQAVPLLHQAAERGEALAQLTLGVMYVQGDGVAQDPVQAFQWISKAAALGEPNAQYLLFTFYAQGIGTEKNIPLAVQWLRKAAAQGHEKAIALLQQVASVAKTSSTESTKSENPALREAKELNSQVITLYQQGKYAEAVPLAERSLAIREQALWPQHPDVATSLNNLAGLYKTQGQYPKAEPLYKRALIIWEKALGPKHPSVALSLNNLAALYDDQGQYAKAEPLYQRALAIDEKALGPEHPAVATRLNNLAALYDNQGQYAKAEPLYQRSLAIREQALGPQHPDVATILNNLAELYLAQGQYPKAEPLYQRALAIWEKALGPKHPSVALSLNNLAALYDDQGQYAKAEPLYQRAMAIQEHALGPQHPLVAKSLNNLAGLYKAQGQYAKAEPLYQRSMAIQEQVLGPQHPDVATSLNNLAELYKAQGQYAKAEPLYQRSMAILEHALGPQHPLVAKSLNNLAGLYEAQGQYAKAEILYQRSLAILEQVLGPQHQDVATSLNNLALLYQTQGQYAKAEPLCQRALAIREKALGPEHPDVALGLNNLAGLYYAQSQYPKAEPLYQRALAIREKALGPQHPDVAQSLNNLAELYRTQGQYPKAEPLYQRALAIREKALGPEHPDVASSLSNLAVLYETQGQYAKAEPLYQRALAIQEQALGPEHPDVAVSLNNLAVLYYSQGQYPKAEPLYQRALAIWEKALGPEHPDVAKGLSNLAMLYHAQGQYPQTLDHIRKASRIYHDRILANSRTASSGGDSERTGFKGTFSWHLRIAAARMVEAPELRTELTDESFEIGQLFHDGPVGDALARMAARFAGGSSALANLARDKEDTQQQWQKADADLIAAVGKPTVEQNPMLIQDLRTRNQELQTKLTGLNERLAEEFPDYAELTVPKPVTLAQAQQLLKPGEALIAFALGEEKSFVWLITPDSASFRQIDRSAADIDKQVKTLRATLSPDDNEGLQQPFPVATAHALYQDILGPEAAQLAGVKTLFVAADGALESLPFAVLVTAAPTGDYPKISWLSRKVATVTLPTVSSLRALRTLASKGQAATQPFVGFGDPNLQGVGNNKQRGVGGVRLTIPTNNGLVDPKTLRDLSPLPETADELRAIAQTLGAGTDTIFLQEQASVPTVRTMTLANYRVVDFATHALVAGETEEYTHGQAEPGIVLTPPQVATAENDGLLRASQVAQLKLNADWVVLSACNTAAPDGTPGAVGLSGLAKAFFYAGAKAMLVSHWSVASKPAVALTTGMFKVWQDQPELGRAEALRQAEMAVLDNPDEPYFTHPGAWAPFVVAGEGGVGR